LKEENKLKSFSTKNDTIVFFFLDFADTENEKKKNWFTLVVVVVFVVVVDAVDVAAISAVVVAVIFKRQFFPY